MRSAAARFAVVAVLGVCSCAGAFALSGSAPAVAVPSGVPVVGECYDLSDAELQAVDWWSEPAPVACTEPHTVQITEVGLLPADVNAFDFAADQCGALEVWTEVGVNVPEAGIVEAPLRVLPWSTAVRQTPASFACGAVVASLNGAEPWTAVPVSSSIERLSARDRAALRYCADASRPARAPQVTVPCTTRPRWEVTRWVLWTAFVDAYPGRAALRARAARLCGPGQVASLPSAASWDEGLPRTWCYRQRR